MKEVVDRDEREQVAKTAQDALDRHQPRNYRISVNSNAILKDDDWYHIVVTTPNDVRDREFYESLAEAEGELQDENGHQYLLVPVVGD
jgi:hypothetical protein